MTRALQTPQGAHKDLITENNFQTRQLASSETNESGSNSKKGRSAAIREECHDCVKSGKFDAWNNVNPSHRHNGGSVAGNGINVPVRDGDNGAIVVVRN